MASQAVAQRQSLDIKRFLTRYGTLIAFVILVAYFSLTNDNFFTVGNLLSIMRFSAVTGIIALGATFPLAVGAFDISFSAAAGLVSVVTAMVIRDAGIGAGILTGLGVAVLFGLMNGGLVTVTRLSSIIVTMSAMFLGEGLELYISRGLTIRIPVEEQAFSQLSLGRILGVPNPVLILAVSTLLLYLFATHTKYGRYIYAIGDNPTASFLAGIRHRRYVTLTFVISSVFAGIGGMMLVSRSSSAIPLSTGVYLLNAFAAIFLGATVGGKGVPHPLGTTVGALFLGVLANGMILMDMPQALQSIAKGLVVIGSVIVSSWVRREEVQTEFM